MTNKYMLLEAQPLNQDQIDQAIKRAHVMRSEAAWTVFVKVGTWFSKKLHSSAQDRSNLAHSA